jgi:hypothetical protein
MTTYYFLVDDPSDEIVIASIEADSPKEAFARLQPLYEPYSLLWLPDYQEPDYKEDEGPNAPA